MTPIKGFSDRPRLLPRLGKLHLGVRLKKGQTEYPRATDYFVVEDSEMGERLKAHLKSDKPKELRIVFPTDTPEQWANPWYRAYSSYRGLVCKGDGQSASRMVDLGKVVDRETGQLLPKDRAPWSWPMAGRDTQEVQWFDIECPGMQCPDYQRKACRQSMCLQFIIPDFPVLGVWQVDTGSWRSMRNVLDGVELVRAALGGRVAMVPLRLSLEPVEVSPEGVKKRVHVLKLTVPYSLEALQQAALTPASHFSLPEPDLSPLTDLYINDVEGEEIPPEEEAPFSEDTAPAESEEEEQGPPDTQRPPASSPQQRSTRRQPSELQQAWGRVRERLGADGNARVVALRWLAMTTGRDIPARVFEGKAPPASIPVRLVYQLDANLDEITQRKGSLS